MYLQQQDTTHDQTIQNTLAGLSQKQKQNSLHPTVVSHTYGNQKYTTEQEQIILHLAFD